MVIEQIQCEGGCPLHQGDVQTVHVAHPHKDFGQFNYCEAAIEEDVRRGLTVEAVIELTDDQAAQLHTAFVACAATEISMLTAPKSQQPALEAVAVWQRHKIENVLAEAAQRH